MTENQVPMDAGRRQIREVTDDTDMCNGCEDSCKGCVSDAVCVMDWYCCMETTCDLYTSGCPHLIENQNTVDHCATCGHYREWYQCEAGDGGRKCLAADIACELYTTERASDLIDDGYGIRARGGLVYFG